jgi:hypothetical protein
MSQLPMVELTGGDDLDPIVITRIAFTMFESQSAAEGIPLLPPSGLDFETPVRIPRRQVKRSFPLLADIAGLLDGLPIFGSDLRAIEKAFVQWDDVYVRAISD